MCAQFTVGSLREFQWQTLPLVSQQKVNGFGITDAWGSTWDGLNRRADTWQEAKDRCEDLGGRLPTMSELFRNNQLSGFSTISDYDGSTT